MQPSPVSAFTRNLVGFAVFLSVSFGVTYAVNTITAKQTQEQQVAAAATRMLELSI
jgi:hypothetical protein